MYFKNVKVDPARNRDGRKAAHRARNRRNASVREASCIACYNYHDYKKTVWEDNLLFCFILYLKSLK